MPEGNEKQQGKLQNLEKLAVAHTCIARLVISFATKGRQTPAT